MRRIELLGALLVASTVVAGCSQSTAGTPQSEPGVTRTAPSSQAVAPVNRPRVLTLDSKDPCSLIRQDDLAKLGVERPGQPGQSEVFKSAECRYISIGAGLTITLVTTEGVDAWAPGKRQSTAKDEPPIAGFPTKSLLFEVNPDQCAVLVDVADGQYLLATTNVASSTVDRHPEKCAYARQLAEAAMTTLLGG